MTFVKVCELDDLWEGEMGAFEVNEHKVLLVSPEGGEICAFQGICPHQQIPLIDGHFDGKLVTCKAHQWVFDGTTGKGVGPAYVDKVARVGIRVGDLLERAVPRHRRAAGRGGTTRGVRDTGARGVHRGA